MPPLSINLCPQLTQCVLSNCKARGIRTVTDFILIDPEDLAKKIKIPYKDVLTIRRMLLAKHAPFAQNADNVHSELLESISILNTGSERLNSFLSGGIYTGEVTEICGPPGAGKTQLCLSVIANLIRTTNGTAFYLDSGCNFVGERIMQMLTHRSNQSEDFLLQKMKNVKVQNVVDIYSFFDCLDVLKLELSKKEDAFFKHMRILIIDSITPLLAPCFGGKHLDGPGLMSNVDQQLKILSSEHMLAVLVCNNTVQSVDRAFKPALGPNWKYIPSVSLSISKLRAPVHKISASKSCRNGLFGEIHFNITEHGLVD